MDDVAKLTKAVSDLTLKVESLSKDLASLNNGMQLERRRNGMLQREFNNLKNKVTQNENSIRRVGTRR